MILEIVEDARNRTMESPELGHQIGDYRRAYVGPQSRAVQIIMMMNEWGVVTREDRLATLRDIFGREFTTSKELTFAETSAIFAYERMLRGRYKKA